MFVISDPSEKSLFFSSCAVIDRQPVYQGVGLNNPDFKSKCEMRQNTKTVATKDQIQLNKMRSMDKQKPNHFPQSVPVPPPPDEPFRRRTVSVLDMNYTN